MEIPSPKESENSARGSTVRYEQVLLEQALANISKKEYQAAASVFHDILKRASIALDDSQKSLIHSELATVAFWLGDYESAKRNAERALTLGNRNDQAYVILGKIAVARFQFQEARSYFSQISYDHPGRHLGLCLVALKVRDTTTAQHHLQEAASKITRSDPEYQVYETYLELLKGDAKAAVLRARDLIAKCDRDPSLLLFLGEIFMTAGNYGEAKALANQVMKTCSDNDQIHGIFANAAYAEEDFALAESHAKQAVHLNPKNAYAKTILVKLATRRGHYSIAESIGKEIIAESPDYSLGHANLGDVYFIEGRYELAKLEYEQTQELMNAGTKGARLRQARMNFISEDYHAAAEILERLIETSHTYYDDAMCDLALCYEKIGDKVKKEDVLEKMKMRKSFYHRMEKILQELK